ncbi:hypothetical protein GGQ10_000633 [Salinibacter ruber]|nr:hypothetical protein [Salinibacter ruber]MCS4085834.1 hypothetical protein [Salinibacter ruber]
MVDWPSGALIAIGTVLGATIGSLMSAGGELIQQHQARKAKFRKVLFDLLRIWDALFSLYYMPTPEEVYQAFSQALQKRYPEIPEQELTQALENAPEWVTSKIDDHYDRLVSLKFEDWSAEEYLSSVAEISDSSPVISFKIASRGRLNELINTADQYLRDLGEESVDQKALDEHALHKFKEQIARSLIDDLEDDVRTVARKSGLLKYVWTIRAIKRIKRRRQLSDPEKIEEAMRVFEKWLRIVNPDLYEELQSYK